MVEAISNPVSVVLRCRDGILRQVERGNSQVNETVRPCTLQMQTFLKQCDVQFLFVSLKGCLPRFLVPLGPPVTMWRHRDVVLSCREAWQYVLSDESRRCFAAYLSCPFSQEQTKRSPQSSELPNQTHPAVPKYQNTNLPYTLSLIH